MVTVNCLIAWGNNLNNQSYTNNDYQLNFQWNWHSHAENEHARELIHAWNMEHKNNTLTMTVNWICNGTDTAMLKMNTQGS